jgi:hypothetical protein
LLRKIQLALDAAVLSLNREQARFAMPASKTPCLPQILAVESQLLSTFTLVAIKHWKCAVSVVVSDRYGALAWNALFARAANTIATLKEHSG